MRVGNILMIAGRVFDNLSIESYIYKCKIN